MQIAIGLERKKVRSRSFNSVYVMAAAVVEKSAYTYALSTTGNQFTNSTT